MQVKEIIRKIEKFAPLQIAWEKDNTGLQVGNPENEISNIFLTVDLNNTALNQAIKLKCNLIISHHPIIFTPIKKINLANDEKSLLIEKILKNNITVYSAHTNLDFTKNGVSFELAQKLGLENIEFLEKSTSNKFKLVTFVPDEFKEKLSDSLFAAGAGKIGEYSNCSFQSEGYGTFLGSEKSNPRIGRKENFEIVNETRLEVIVDSWNLNNVIQTLLNVHPYETPAYDIYKLENQNENAGFGAVGFLPDEMSVNQFLKYVAEKLSIKNFRYAKGKSSKIRKVAVCGGSGTELLTKAIKINADAFITADIKYHTFQDAENKILFIDAGHYETEIFGLNSIRKILEKQINDKKIKIILNKKSTSPIKFFNNKGDIN
jgi:dinuclear metal center YbgI/SA1388 family protein